MRELFLQAYAQIPGFGEDPGSPPEVALAGDTRLRLVPRGRKRELRKGLELRIRRHHAALSRGRRALEPKLGLRESWGKLHPGAYATAGGRGPPTSRCLLVGRCIPGVILRAGVAPRASPVTSGSFTGGRSKRGC